MTPLAFSGFIIKEEGEPEHSGITSNLILLVCIIFGAFRKIITSGIVMYTTREEQALLRQHSERDAAYLTCLSGPRTVTATIDCGSAASTK